MVQAGGLVEEPQERRQVDRKPPVVLASAEGFDSRGRLAPPGRQGPRDWFDDENACSARSRIKQLPFERNSAFAIQFVEHVPSNHCAGWFERGKASQISRSSVTAKTEVSIRPTAFLHSPSMPVDARDARGSAGAERPGSAPDAGPAAEIDDVGRRGRAGLDRAKDLSNREQVKGTVEEREGCPFAGGIERRPGRKCLAALDVRGGQCPQRPGDLGHPELSEVTGLEG